MPNDCVTRRPRAAVLKTLALGLLLPVLQAAAADTPSLHTRALAATCAHCHGTEGRAVQGEAMVRLAGLKEDFILTQLLAFRTGQRPATIMHQITRGYSQEQLAEVAKYFAAQK
jgi:cytochrome subunit of sulfide dehydrogenase